MNALSVLFVCQLTAWDAVSAAVAGDRETLIMQAVRKDSAKKNVRLLSYLRRMNAMTLRQAWTHIVCIRAEVVTRSTQRPSVGVQRRKSQPHFQEAGH